MALDPTAAPTGWGLGAIGTPSVSTMPLAPRPQFSPDQIAQMRKEAMALQAPQTEPIHHWTQGLAELVRAIQGNREADFARQQETTGRQQGASDTAKMIAPYLSPGGDSSAPSPGGAPAGTLGSGPAGAMPSTTTADASATHTDTSAPYGSAIAGIESGGSKNPYTLVGPPTGKMGRALGKYQVMEANVPEWTQAALGKPMTSQDFLANPDAQEAVFKHRFGQYVQKYGPEGAARAWFAGEGGMNNPNAKDMLGTTVADYARKFNAASPQQAAAAPTGLLAPIAPPAAPPAAVPAPPPVPANQASAPPAAPVRLAYAGNPPPGMIPSPVTQGATLPPPGMSAQVNAIAGRPMPPSGPMPTPGAAIPPADFARAAAAMEAAKQQPGGPTAPSIPLAPPGAAISPADFAKQAAILEALKQQPGGSAGPSVPLGAPPVPPAAAPISPPPAPLSSGPSIGPTSVGGAQLPQPGGMPPATPAMVSAIGGGPAAAGGAPDQPAPIRVAQNGPPTSLAPPAAARSALPQPLLPPSGQVTQEQLTRLLANPWVPQETKAAMLNMIQQRGQVQTLPMEGGILQYDASGRRNWIPQTVYKEFESNGTKMQLEGTRAGPNEPMVWKPITPGAGGPAQPGAPDYSTPAGRDAIAAASAAAKKGAEEGATASAKYYDAVHRGLAGSGMIAAQQKQNIDALRQIASSPDFISGTFANSGLAIQRLAAGLGINPTGAAPRELFNQLAAKVLADQFSGLKSMASETGEAGGRVFKPMLDIEEKANITPEDTAAGIGAKLNLLDNAGNLMMKYADMADDYIKDPANHGRLDAGFDKAIRKEIASSKMSGVVPQAAQPSAQTSDANAAWEAEMKRRGLLNKPVAAPVSQ